MARKTYWVRKLKIKKGALRKQLGVPAGKPIPKTALKKIANAKIGSKVTVQIAGKKKTLRVTTKLKRRVVLALNFRKMRKVGRKKKR